MQRIRSVFAPLCATGATFAGDDSLAGIVMPRFIDVIGTGMTEALDVDKVRECSFAKLYTHVPTERAIGVKPLHHFPELCRQSCV